MISTEVEARATLPTYMTYPDTWRTKQQPPEFLRPAPKPLTQLRYNGLTTSLINGLSSQHSTSPPSTLSRPTPPHLPPSQTNLPPTPSPSPSSTPTTPLRTCGNNKFSPPILVNNNSSNSSSRSNSSSPVNLSANPQQHKGMLLGGDEALGVMTPDELQYTAYRIFAPSFVPGVSPYHTSPYAVYAAAAAAASSPYALLPPRTAPYIPVATVAPPLSPLIDPTTYSTPTGTYLSPTSTPVIGGGSIMSGTSAKAANVVGGSISSGTSLLRERRPPGVGANSGFKIPSGKEGSLKHRILQTRGDGQLEGQVLDLQQKGAVEGASNCARKRLCATLSPPPPTLAPPPITSVPLLKHPPNYQSKPPKHFQSTYQQQQSSESLATITPGSNGVKRPQSSSAALITGGFMRGTFIQLGGGELRRVEDMRTEDFVQSAERSPGLRLAESTVLRIAENRVTGGAMVTLSYNERRTQVTQIEVESSWEHPYFVMGAGWASCKPELTYQYYGLRVSRLQVGDILVSLTPREQPLISSSTTATQVPIIKRETRHSVTPPSSCNINSSNVNSYNSHFRSPNSQQQSTSYMPPYSTSTYQPQQHALLLRNGQPHNSNTTITTVTGTAMTSRPMTYAAPAHTLGLVMRATQPPHVHHASAQHQHSPAQHQLPVAVVPAVNSTRSARSMSPDSLARKRRWSAPDQLSDDEQQPINRRSKTE